MINTNKRMNYVKILFFNKVSILGYRKNGDKRLSTLTSLPVVPKESTRGLTSLADINPTVIVGPAEPPALLTL